MRLPSEPRVDSGANLVWSTLCASAFSTQNCGFGVTEEWVISIEAPIGVSRIGGEGGVRFLDSRWVKFIQYF